MPQDNRRINGPENVVWPITFMKNLRSKSLVDEKSKLRLDGRKLDELRPSILKVGVTSEATGSAYLECGNTKILCSVYGPRDTLKRSEFSDKGQLCCEFKYAPFSCQTRQSYIPSSEEKGISLSILQALESVVLVQKFPKARLDVFIMVIENDGSVVSSALTCAGTAICNAGVEMYDMVVGCSLRQYGKYMLMDPDFDEEELPDKATMNHGRVTIGMMPSLNQAVMLVQDGEFEVPVLSHCIKESTLTCQKILSLVTETVWRSVESKEKESGIEHITDIPQRQNLQFSVPCQVFLFIYVNS